MPYGCIKRLNSEILDILKIHTNSFGASRTTEGSVGERPNSFTKVPEFNVKYSTTSVEVSFSNNIKIILGKNYPFTAPTVFINDLPYDSFLLCKSQRITKYIRDHFNISCLCCSSVITRHNWSPCYCILKIIQEINQVNMTKKTIKYSFGVEDIAKKHNLPGDIEKYILSFLVQTPSTKPTNSNVVSDSTQNAEDSVAKKTDSKYEWQCSGYDNCQNIKETK